MKQSDILTHLGLFIKSPEYFLITQRTAKAPAKKRQKFGPKAFFLLSFEKLVRQHYLSERQGKTESFGVRNTLPNHLFSRKITCLISFLAEKVAAQSIFLWKKRRCSIKLFLKKKCFPNIFFSPKNLPNHFVREKKSLPDHSFSQTKWMHYQFSFLKNKF